MPSPARQEHAHPSGGSTKKPASILRATAALALAAALLPAQAAPVQFDFSATVGAGPFVGEVGTGFIRFDDAFAGSTAVSPGAAAGSLEISFTFMGMSA